jgi:hypothetical protein
MLQWILSFVGGPIITGLIDAYKLKLASVNQTDANALELAKADLLAQIEARKEATILAGNRGAGIIQNSFAVIILVFTAKVVIWDDMLGWGETPAIHGEVATWMNLIISFYFGGQIVSGVVNTVARRFGK